jgi:hypothetical protein
MDLDFLNNIGRADFHNAAERLMNHYCIIKRDSRDASNPQPY